ncbi:MAG: mechanosensitive ion channel family protein [Xenococcaceae cyanobacterium]
MNNFFLQILDKALRLVPKLGASLLIFIGFWLAAVFFHKIIIQVGKRGNLNPYIIKLSAQLVKISILMFGLVTALGTLGIDVSALVAALGLTTFAVGFAFKDILQNLVSGALLLIHQPFQRDDRISVAGFEGKVINIDLRYTTLQAEDKKILVPNSSLFSNTISVFETK